MIVQTQTTSFKLELYQAIHNLAADTLKIALYTAQADLNAGTTVYTPDGEVTGAGYVAGGKTLTGVTIGSQGTTAYVNFSDVVWSPATFTTRCALIYNATRENRAIAVLDFGADKTASTTFTVSMPVASASTALIRSSN